MNKIVFVTGLDINKVQDAVNLELSKLNHSGIEILPIQIIQTNGDKFIVTIQYIL